jgi:hypothetical protein
VTPHITGPPVVTLHFLGHDGGSAFMGNGDQLASKKKSAKSFQIGWVCIAQSTDGGIIPSVERNTHKEKAKQ